MERQIQRQEAWRIQYRNERYLRDLSETELLARAGDLMTVTLEHSRDGKIALSPISEDPSSMERFTHVLEELVIRGIDYRQPAIIEAMQAPKPNSPKVRRALQILSLKKWPDSILVKFGERKHMTSLFLDGKGRISLAKTYNDPSLGNARADDESKISVYVDPRDAHRLMAIEQSENGSRGVDMEVPYRGSVRIELQATSHFYVYCMAESCDARMFDDFTTPTCNIDTCLVVTSPDDFRARIAKAIASKLPGWKFLNGPVMYVDPFFARVHHVSPQFCKHFRFRYQKESRFLWIPSEPVDDCSTKMPDHVYFDVGPLTDCAKLIWL